MGIDCPNVRHIIHWGVSDDIEMYVQESGRAGRDGCLFSCLMLYGARDLDKTKVSESMINYYENKSAKCCRESLFAEFDGYSKTFCGCECCDVCRLLCECGKCEDTIKPIIATDD
jgi:ATP-dependent DNA helicase RecQ